ncbi:hypothetical protein ACVWXO_000683 [Bradyrhizobium sp. LM2.7]
MTSGRLDVGYRSLGGEVEASCPHDVPPFRFSPSPTFGDGAGPLDRGRPKSALARGPDPSIALRTLVSCKINRQPWVEFSSAVDTRLLRVPQFPAWLANLANQVLSKESQVIPSTKDFANQRG